MNTIIDPRRGVPSASSMERLDRCPGSWLATKDLPEDDDSEDAASGTRIHKALETGDMSDLQGDEWETAEMCKDQGYKVHDAWLNESPDFAVVEERLGLTAVNVLTVTNESTESFLFTGQADMVVVEGKRGLVIDYKTGRGEVEEAAKNKQLLALAVLVARRYKLTDVRVAIVQPWAGKPSVADYDAPALYRANKWLLSRLEAAKNATPDDLCAGDWCKYCKAKATASGVCPALKETALEPVERMTMGLTSQSDETTRAALFARAMECDADILARLMKGLKLLGWYAAAIEGAAKKRAADDADFQRHYRLKPGVVRETITDVSLVFQRVHELGITADTFAANCKVTKGAVETMVRSACGVKGSALKAKVKEVLAGAAEAKETSATLEVVK